MFVAALLAALRRRDARLADRKRAEPDARDLGRGERVPVPVRVDARQGRRS